MTHKIEIKTVFGTLIAELSGDSTYPGIYISLITPEGERQIALVESTPDTPADGTYSLRLLSWDPNAEPYDDYSTSLILFEVSPAPACEAKPSNTPGICNAEPA